MGILLLSGLFVYSTFLANSTCVVYHIVGSTSGDKNILGFRKNAISDLDYVMFGNIKCLPNTQSN